MQLAPGTHLDLYEIVAPIGSGGMGEVYHARDTRLQRDVALKFLSEEFARDEQAVKRFQREARAASALNHPHVCTIHTIGEHEGRPFIVMELLQGQSLKERQSQAPFELGQLLDFAIQIADALEAAHAAGIVHRDIKPANIFLIRRNQIKLLDFGLAKQAAAPTGGVHNESSTAFATQDDLTGSAVLGTVAYMSPEQARGEQLDARTDLFSFAVVLYEMATGVPPFQGRTPTSLFEAILTRAPVPIVRLNPGVPADLVRIINKGLEKDPEVRYQSAKELLVDLQRLKRDLSPQHETATKLQPPRPSAGPVQKFADSLAVLPLACAGQDPDVEELADELTESVINSLSCLPKLRVIPRSTVFRYKGLEVVPTDVGRELDVRLTLTGRVARRGENLIVKMELVDVANDSQLWGAQYNRTLGDAFGLHEEVVRGISGKLRLPQKTDQSTKRIPKPIATNTEAHHLYLRGRHHWNKRTEEAVKKGLADFQQAIEKDPSYALAYAGLADAYNMLGRYGVMPARQAFTKAKAAAMKALELNENLAEAHGSLAFVLHRYEWDWAGAEREFKRAVACNPDYGNVRTWYGLLLIHLGRHDEALRELKQAQECDPLSPIIALNVAHCSYYARQYDRAIEGYRAILEELDPQFGLAHYWLGSAYVLQGKCGDAIHELEKAAELLRRSANALAALGHAYGVCRRTQDAQARLAELNELAGRKYVPAFEFAYVLIGLGDRDGAFGWLDRAYEEHSELLIWLGVDPKMDDLRSDPRFTRLLRMIGLAPG